MSTTSPSTHTGGMLPEKDRMTLKAVLDAKLTEPVALLLFTEYKSAIPSPIGHQCALCQELTYLMQEIVTLSPKLKLEKYDFLEHEALAKKYGVDKIPALILQSSKGKTVRYFGTPAGYEFAAFLQDLQDLSAGKTNLSESNRQKLGKVIKPVHIQVFVSPTCPYCPRAVVAAHKLAIENTFIVADMIESMEFGPLANKYKVMGVPKIVINDQWAIEGSVNDDMLVLAVQKAAGLPLTASEEAKLASLIKPFTF